MNKFRMFLVGISIVVIIGFFLPWTRPLSTPKDKTKIPANEPSFVWDFLLMQQRDREDFMLTEPEGITAYQMVLSNDKTSRVGKITQAITQHLWNSDNPDWRVKLLILFPLLALISHFCFLHEETPVAISMGLAFAQVILYAAVRWQLNTGYLLHVEMALAPGLWLTIYGSLLLALGNLGMCVRK